jgi:hypothetical protein
MFGHLTTLRRASRATQAEALAAELREVERRFVVFLADPRPPRD